MAKTLGQQLDDVQTAIELALQGQEYKIADRELKRTPFSLLQKREDDLIAKIEMHGRNFIPGQNTTAMRMNVPVTFS